MPERWTRDSWRQKKIMQVPEYPDKAALEKVEREFPGTLSLAITQEKFERWLDREGMTPITRRAYIRDVSGLFRFCVLQKMDHSESAGAHSPTEGEAFRAGDLPSR